MKNGTQIAIWAFALIIAVRLTWMAASHNLPVLDAASIGLFALFGAQAGATHLVRVARANRQTGATR